MSQVLKESLAAGRTSQRAQRRTLGRASIGPRSPPSDSAFGDLIDASSPVSMTSMTSITSMQQQQQQQQPGSDDTAQSSSPRTPSQTSQTSPTPKLTTIPSIGANRESEVSSPEDVDVTADLDLDPDLDLATPAMPPPPSRIPSARVSNSQRAGGEIEELRARLAHATFEAQEANKRLAFTGEKLNESEATCRELEGRLSFLERKSENALGEERSRASVIAKEKAATAAAGRREADLEAQLAELTDACEVLTLDKEQLAMEKEDVQEKLDELQAELDSMKLDMEHAQISAKENEAAARALSAAGGVSGDGAVDVRRVAEQNVQLKEALKRLHSHSIAEKTELTKNVRALEKEVASTKTLKEEVDKLRAWKTTKAIEIEDLMEKLDESKAYEEMVEALTTKNLEIGERCGELEATIVDLESSVELSEELEVRQAEEIRELQAELTVRDVRLHNQKLGVECMVKELDDSKKTIERFRDYAEQLRSTRDALAAAANTGAGGSGLTNLERRALLTQRASLQRMATETRRARVSERLLQIGLFDAQAKSSRVSMLLPLSLVLAETELRCVDADLSAARLFGKASFALELLEVPAMEFVDSLAASVNASIYNEDKNELTVDRAGAMEDCARLLREAEESLSLAQTSGEALAVLRSTVLAASNEWSSRAAAEVSVEVASAVNEAEGLVDGLLRVIQASSALFPTDEGGLPAALTSSTTSALAAIAKTIGARRVAAVASNASNAPHASSDAVTHGAQYGAGVTALQDCFIFVRRAVLETAKAALQDAGGSHVSRRLLGKREDQEPRLCHSVRGLWNDLVGLRSVANMGRGGWSTELVKLATDTTNLLGNIMAHAAAPWRSAPVELELARQVKSSRRAIKELARSNPLSARVEEARSMSRPQLVVPHPSVRTLVCPQTLWRNVAPALFQADDHMTDDLKERGNVFEAACIPRAEEIRASLEEAMHVKPELEASKARISHLAVELASRNKELSAANAKREQLEALIDKTELSQVASLELQDQVLSLKATISKLQQENNFMTEALEDLQDSTSRLEAENRALRKSGSLTLAGRVGSSGSGSGSSGKLIRPQNTPNTARYPSLEELQEDSLNTTSMYAGFADTEEKAEESVLIALKWSLKWSQQEATRWRGEAFKTVLSGLRPLPHLSAQVTQEEGGRTSEQQPEVCSTVNDSLNELISLSKKLAAISGPPRVIRVQQAAQSGPSPKMEIAGSSRNATNDGHEPDGNDQASKQGSKAYSSSAGALWQAHQVTTARLQREWREGQGRAANALSSLMSSRPGGRLIYSS
ncbi:unnamed protein product [Ascophyllum nodosum]